MKEFLVRTLSGIVFVIMILLADWWNPMSLGFLLGFILIAGLNEFYRLCFKTGNHPLKLSGILLSLAILTVSFLVASDVFPRPVLLAIIPLVSIVPAIVLFYTPDTYLGSVGSTYAGMFMITLPLSLFPWIAYSGGSYDHRLISGVFIIIWTFDSFAYISGILIGKHKMMPSISPKKSWEGFAGGTILTLAASLLLAWFWPVLSGSAWMMLALLVIVSGTVGDFLESALKRTAGVKDSGKIMPGHGGILDRFDSFLFAVPFVFVFIEILKYLK